MTTNDAKQITAKPITREAQMTINDAKQITAKQNNNEKDTA